MKLPQLWTFHRDDSKASNSWEASIRHQKWLACQRSTLVKQIFSDYFQKLWAGNSVGIATDYGLDGLGGWISVEARFSAPVQTAPGAHPAFCTMGTASFPGVKCGRSVLLTTNPLLVPRSWKSRAIPLPSLWPHRACNGVTLLTNEIYR
jgi:hypothetical protein